MNKEEIKNIFFHVGTGKTGTTFLQYRVFPKFTGVYYIQRTRYRKAKNIIKSTNYSNYLISSEFDQQLEDEVKSFSADFPNTKPIIVFRRHDSYIASQYRRFLKNGFNNEFTKFFDLENDNGLFKKQNLNYSYQIQILEKYFTQKPIVLFYDDMRNDDKAFVEDLAKRIGASIDFNTVNTSKKHTSYSEKQLKAMMAVGRFVNMKKRRIFKNGLLHLFWRLYLGSIRYSSLYVSKILPNKFFSSEPIVSKIELEKVRNFYASDWENVKAYAKNC